MARYSDQLILNGEVTPPHIFLYFLGIIMEKTISRHTALINISEKILTKLGIMSPAEIIMLGKLCGMDLYYVGGDKFISNEFKFRIGDKVIANYKDQRLLAKIVDIHQNPRGNIYTMLDKDGDIINARESALENL